MTFKLEDWFSNTLIENPGNFKTTGSTKSLRAGTLCYVANQEYAQLAIENNNITAVISMPQFAEFFPVKGLVIHDEPVFLLGEVTNQLIQDGFIKPKMEFHRASSANIHASAIVSEKCFIGENVEIGRNAIVNDYTIIGNNSIIGDNTVLGCDGLFVRRRNNGELFTFLHAGGVNIGEDVEILNNSMVQRAHEDGFTVIGFGTKIGPNVNVAHSSSIGKYCLVAGNTQIAGNVNIGDFSWLGTSVTISDGITIGDRAKVNIGSVVVRNIMDGEAVSGNFAISHTKNLRQHARELRQ